MKAMFNSSLLNDFIKKSNMIKSEGIQIRDVNGKIQLINCDLKNQVTVDVMGDVFEVGSVIVPKKIFPLIKDNQPLTIEDNHITVGSRNIEFALNLEDYPTIEDDFKYNVFDLSDKEVKQLLEVEHAISTDKTKPVLNGVRIEKNKFIAIDGFRMCERTGNFKTEIPIIISDYKIIKSLRGQIKATCSNRYINYQVGDYNFSNRLIDGEFIDSDKLKPRDYNTSLDINRDELLEILETMNKASTGQKNRVVKLGIRKDILHFKTSNEEVELEDSLKCKTAGDNLDIAFNSTYLLEAIKNIKHCVVTMEFTTNVNPVIIKSPKGYELILPVRIASEV